jgi:predicted nuclease of predicted toxin-antitoxin system
MKLLLDMGASWRTADSLRIAGHDVVHLRDRGLQRLPDEAIVQLAAAEQRVIVTFDLDFSRILALSRLASPSIVVFRLEKYSTDQINAILDDVLSRFEEALIAGSVVVIDPSRVRVRRLPIV